VERLSSRCGEIRTSEIHPPQCHGEGLVLCGGTGPVQRGREHEGGRRDPHELPSSLDDHLHGGCGEPCAVRHDPLENEPLIPRERQGGSPQGKRAVLDHGGRDAPCALQEVPHVLPCSCALFHEV